MRLPGQELPKGDLVQGWDALDEAGTQPIAGRCSWEAEQALWDILFIFNWLQGGRQGQRNALVCPQPLITSPVLFGAAFMDKQENLRYRVNNAHSS